MYGGNQDGPRQENKLNNLGFPFPVTLTDDVYWASFDPKVQALRNMDANSVGAAALALAQQGYVIDFPTMVWQEDPVLVMAIRKYMGMTWAPSILQPQVFPVSSGLSLPPYDPNNPPLNSIKVSVDVADYPPFAAPPPLPPQPVKQVVGAFVAVDGDNRRVHTFGYSANPAKLVDGQEVQQDGATYVTHLSHGLFGLVLYFTEK